MKLRLTVFPLHVASNIVECVFPPPILVMISYVGTGNDRSGIRHPTAGHTPGHDQENRHRQVAALRLHDRHYHTSHDPFYQDVKLERNKPFRLGGAGERALHYLRQLGEWCNLLFVV